MLSSRQDRAPERQGQQEKAWEISRLLHQAGDGVQQGEVLGAGKDEGGGGSRALLLQVLRFLQFSTRIVGLQPPASSLGSVCPPSHTHLLGLLPPHPSPLTFPTPKDNLSLFSKARPSFCTPDSVFSPNSFVHFCV